MRLLHTMIRVGDLHRSIDFYTDVLGMKLLRRKDYPDGFTLAFVGYGDEERARGDRAHPQLGIEGYDLGNGFGHIAVAVPDADKACEDVSRRAARSRARPGR